MQILIGPAEQLEPEVSQEGEFPIGHYYSPIPSREEVLTYIETRRPRQPSLPGIDLNVEEQLTLLNDYFEFYKDLPFCDDPIPGLRYYYNNDFFSYSDAIFLYCFLRKFMPKRIIEVGAGFSSAVMLDTIDRFFPQKPQVTFIDPYPDRLLSLLQDADREGVTLIDKKVQEVPRRVLLGLKSDDLLFIDSSHVVKCGSDLQFLMFEILPRLEPGVFVHFHDIFYPFDYPNQWLLRGRYYNEAYFVRAFLSYNSEWKIIFFNTYMHFMFGTLIKEKMPLCAKNPGGSLYIQRLPKG